MFVHYACSVGKFTVGMRLQSSARSRAFGEITGGPRDALSFGERDGHRDNPYQGRSCGNLRGVNWDFGLRLLLFASRGATRLRVHVALAVAS